MASKPSYVFAPSDENFTQRLTEELVIGGGREDPLIFLIRGDDSDPPSYTDTKSADDSVLKLTKTSSITALEEKFHRQSILFLYREPARVILMYPDVLVEVDNTQELVAVRRGAVGK